VIFKTVNIVKCKTVHILRNVKVKRNLRSLIIVMLAGSDNATGDDKLTIYVINVMQDS